MVNESNEYLSLDEIHAIMLDILKDIVNFCDKRDLHYVLTGGSALGAVRHQGFIPWDDDMDIALSRSDYETFLEEYVPASNMELLYSNNTEEWLYPYARVSDIQTQAEGQWALVNNGVYVDVFPIDAVPDSTIKQKINYYHMKWLDVLRNSTRRIAISHDEPFWWLKPAIIKFAQKHPTSFWVNKMEMLARKTNDKYINISKMRSLFVVQGLNGRKEIFDQKVYSQRKLAMFEGSQVYIPENVEVYLRQMYGDWQIVPDVTVRKSHAKFYRKGS